MKFLCIGSMCDGHIFANRTDCRIKGPVDNMLAQNFLSVRKLLNGDFFNSVYKNQYEISLQHWNGREYKSFDLDGFSMVHNDFSEETVKKELKLRIKTFEEELHNEDVYFLYTPSSYEEVVTLNDINEILLEFPFLRGRVFVLDSGRWKLGKLGEVFPIIKANPSKLNRKECCQILEEFAKKNNLPM